MFTAAQLRKHRDNAFFVAQDEPQTNEWPTDFTIELVRRMAEYHADRHELILRFGDDTYNDIDAYLRKACQHESIADRSRKELVQLFYHLVDQCIAICEEQEQVTVEVQTKAAALLAIVYTLYVRDHDDHEFFFVSK